MNGIRDFTNVLNVVTPTLQALHEQVCKKENPERGEKHRFKILFRGREP